MLGAAIVVIETFRSTEMNFVRDRIEGTKKEERILAELKARRNLVVKRVIVKREIRRINEKREKLSGFCAFRLFSVFRVLQPPFGSLKNSIWQNAPQVAE
jgi:hypothetical protein